MRIMVNLYCCDNFHKTYQPGAAKDAIECPDCGEQATFESFEVMDYPYGNLLG